MSEVEDLKNLARHFKETGQTDRFQNTLLKIDELSQEPSFLDQAKEVGGDVLDVGLRGLDFLGGAVRTAGAGVGELVTGEDLLQEGDIQRALEGKAPPTSEILERAGIGELGSVSDLAPGLFAEPGQGDFLTPEKGGALDITGRGAIGFAGDVLTDPLTFASLGTAPLVKGALKKGAAKQTGRLAKQSTKSKILNPIGALTDKVGTKQFRAGFKKIDEAAKEFGKGDHAFSDLLLKHRVSGSVNNVKEQLKDVSSDLLNQRNKLVSSADEAGGVFNIRKATAETKKQIKRLKAGKDHIAGDVAKKFEKQILNKVDKAKSAPAKKVKPTIDDLISGNIPKEIPASRPVKISEGLDIKSSVSGKLNNADFSDIARNTQGKKLVKTLAKGLKEESENAVEKALGNQTGQQLKNINSDLGIILSTAKKTKTEAGKEVTKNAVTSIDGILAGLGLVNPSTIPLLVTKKMADISKTAAFRSKAGKGLRNIGRSGAVDPLVRQGSVEAGREDKPFKDILKGRK